MKTTVKRRKAFLLLVLVLCNAVFSWTETGHKTIAVIAEHNLSRATLTKVGAWLLPGQTLESISGEADKIAQERPETKPWHYIDLPVRENITVKDLPVYYAVGDFKDANLVTQLKRDVGQLKSACMDSSTRRQALVFLVHFMGDLHQPLHCSNDNDRGGSDKKLTLTGQAPNLHKYWDFLLEKGEPIENPEKFGALLGRKITSRQKDAWSTGTVEDWAFETYAFSKNAVYKNLKPGPGTLALPEDYYRTMRPRVDEQLEKAGVRLAYVLQEIFGN